MSAKEKKTQTKPSSHSRSDWLWFLLAAAIPLYFCARQLTLDFWFDEQYTLGTFVSKPVAEIATSYPEPNNHVFYSMVLRPFYLISSSEIMMRFPSLIFSVGTLGIVFLLGRRFGDVATGCAATSTLGLMQLFQNYTMQVRGYSLSMFLAMGLLYLATSLENRSSKRRRIGITFVAAALLYTLPTNILFLVPIILLACSWTWAGTRCWKATGGEFINWALGGLAGVLCYVPIWSDVRRHANTVEQPIVESWQLVCEFFSLASRDFFVLLLIAAIGLVGFVRRKREEIDSAIVWIAAICLTGPWGLIVLLRVSPFIRNFTPLLPIFALALGWLVVEAINLTAGTSSLAKKTFVAIALVTLVCLPSIWTFESRLIHHRAQGLDEDDYFLFHAVDFHPSKVAKFLSEAIGPDERYLICYTDVDQRELGYYLETNGVRYRRTSGDPYQGDWAVVYWIAAGQPDLDALSKKCGLDPDELSTFPQFEKFGHFTIHRSLRPRLIRIPREN